MPKQFYFFKKVGGLENNAFLTLWDLLESWTSQNNWMAILFIIFLGIIFEIILIKICTAFQKKPALPSEKDNTDAHKKEDSCLKSMKFDNWSIHSSSEERVDDFSERTITSSLTSEGNEGNFGDRVSLPDEPTRASTSESKYRLSHFSESHEPSSDGTSSSLSLFHSEVQGNFPRCRGCPENEHETIQFSSKKLFSIMKDNENKNLMFSSDFNFSRISRIIIESEDIDVAPCPPAHLLLSRDQVRLLEENVRNQIPLKSKATLESKTPYLYSRSQEPLIQNQHSVRRDISAEAQDSFPGQSALPNQDFSEAQFTSQAQQLVNNQVSINSQPDIKARYVALPQDLMRKPLSSSTQDSFQTQDRDRSQHLVQVPYSVETQDSIKDLESDTKHSEEAQYSVWFEDSNKIQYSIPGQNNIFNNARHLVLALSPNSVAKVMPQLKSVKTKGQKQIASSELNQYPAYGSVPLSSTMTRQKNRRKTLHSKSKFSLKVLPQKSKKTPTSWVFQITVCHTSEYGKLRHSYKTKKKELHQRKGISGLALCLIYAFKLVPPYIRKYSRKRLAKFMPGLTGCRHFLLKQNKSLYAEKVNYAGPVEKRGTSGSTKNEKHHGRDNKELKHISPKIPPQLEESFMVNIYQQKAPCSSLIETNWKNKESLKDPILQAKEMDITEFCAPNSEKTSDLHIAKHETPLEEAISAPLQKFDSSPKMESDRRMKTCEDLKSTENSHLLLTSGEKLPTSTSEMQRCFPKGNTHEKEDFLEIVLESSDVNLLISLGTKKHKSSEQSAGVEIQESPEGVIEKEKKPLIVNVTEDGDLSESEELECNTRSSIKNRQDERISDAFHDATHTALSEPPHMEMQSGLKTKTDTSRIGLSHSAVKQDELPDDKKTWSAEYIEKRCIFKKPQEHDREEEQQALQEADPQLTLGFRFSLQLKQKPKYVKFEIGQSCSESRTTQNEELEVQPHTLSTETIVGTGPCPTMDPFQVEKVKQSTDRPTGRETADPVHPLTVSQSLPVLTETTEHGVPLCGSPGKPLDDQITEEKEDLKRVLPEVALGSLHRRMLPLSSEKRQRIRKKLPETKNVCCLNRVITKVKTPPIHRRRRLRDDFKIMIKQILQDETVADMLLNVIDPHVSILPYIITHSRLNAENHSHTKLKQEISEVEREEKCSDTITKGSDSGDTPEAAKLQDEVSGEKEASPEAVLEDRWNLRLDAYPEKELKTKKEMQQPSTFAEIMMESVYSAITDPFHAENMKKSLTTQTDLRCTAHSEMPPPASEKSLIGDPLTTRESDVPDYGSDTREMVYSFAETKAELPKDLPAIFPETFNCHMPVLSHSKVKKNRVRFSHLESRVKSKSVHMKALKPSISQICNITGHRKKLESDFKAKFEKINKANGLAYEFLNTLYSPVYSRLQGETNSFCHAQVKLQGLAHEGRPQYVDFFDKSSAFYDREGKVQDGEEEEQKTLLVTAPQHTQCLWINGYQGKETHLAEPDPALDRLTQEQDIQHRTCFTQIALQTGLQMGPREAKELQKINKPEDDITAPTGLEIPAPEAGEQDLPAPETSQGLIFNIYQKKNHDLVKSHEELKQPGSINIQVQPQTHFAQIILSSASCPTLDQFQLRKLESYARFSPPMSGEAKIDEHIFSARECGVPSDANHQKEQADGIEKKETVTLDFCLASLSISKSKRNFKQYSDLKILMKPKCGILKAKKPSISNMFNIKGGASPNHRKELGYNLTTKIKEVDEGEKMADDRYSLTSIIPAVNRYSKREREKNMLLGEKRLSSKQVKREISPREGNITPGDTKETNLQDEEEEEGEQEMLLKIIPQHSQHFVFCSGQRKELDLHKWGNKGRGKILFVTEQDVPRQTQLPDPTQAEEPKRSQQTLNGTVWSASSTLPFLKSKESLIGRVLIDTMKCDVPSNGRCTGDLYDHGKEEKTEFKEDLQATVLGHTYPELEKSPSDGEAWEANLADTQSRSSNTGKMNVPHKKEEENIPEMLAESILHYSQHFHFSSHHMKNLGPCKPKSKLNSSEGRRTWNLSCATQNMRQEEHIRETILEPVSRNVMNFIRVQTLKKSLHTQEGIQYMVGLKTPFPKARKSETGSIQCDGLWDGNPRRKWDRPISKKKTWNQSDLVRTVLKPLDFSSLDSSEPKSQSYTLEVADKKNTTSPKQVILEAEKPSILQVLNSTRCLTGSHRKKPHKVKYKIRERQWNESVRETLLLTTEGTKIPTPKLVIDQLSFDTAARDTLYNDRTRHKNLGGLITEKKAELEENLATTLLGPLDLFTPVLSDSESQINTVQEKIILNPRCLALKKKEPLISQILEINRQFATKQRTKLRSNLKTKMKEIWQGKNVAVIFTNAIYFALDTSDVKRQSRFKTEIDRVSRFSPVQPTHMESPVESRVILQSVNATGHAALSINKEQEQEQRMDIEREKTVLNADLKSTDASTSIPPHIKMEQSPSTWGNYEESSEKRNALNKAKVTEEEEYEQQVLFGTPPQNTQPFEFLQTRQQEPCVSGTIQNSAYAYNPKYPKIIKHKANAKAAGVKNTTHTEQVKLKAKKPLVSLMCNTTGYGTQSNEKETRCNIKKQKPGFQQGKAEVELVLKTICDSGSIPPQIQALMEAEREKGKAQRLTHIPPEPKLEKALNRRQIAFSQSIAKSAKSRNIKTLKQYIREQEEKYQIASPDVLPQCKYRFVMSQPLKKEPDDVKFTVDLKRQVYPDRHSQKRETNCTTFDISRIRLHTKHKFLITPGVKEGDGDMAQHPFPTLQWREVSKKTDISLSSKGQNMFLPELDASQQKTCKEQKLLKQGSISRTHLEHTLYPIMETPHLENTGKVSEEGTYIDRKNISHLLGREGLRETDILQGSKGQTFLCTNVEAQQYMSAVQKGEVKPDHAPERTLDSLSCPSEEPLHVKGARNTTGKENVNMPIVSNVNPWRKEKPKLTDILSKSNGQKIKFSKKQWAKQQNSSNQKEENLLESVSSCILHQLHIGKRKKEVSARGISPTVLSPVVEKASNKADIPVDQPPCSEGINLHIGGRKEHQQENTCKALLTSVSHSLMNILQIKLLRVMKALKEVDSPTYHTSNTEGIGLPKASEEQEKCTYEALRKSASHSQVGLCQTDTPVQEVKLDGTNRMNCEYSPPQAKKAFKGMGVIVGYIQKSEERQNLPSIEQSQQHLLTPSENLLEHTSYPQNDLWLLPHLTPLAKEALSEVGSVSSRTKGLDLISKDQLNTGCEYGLEWTVPSIPPRQTTKQNTRPPLESFTKTVKYQNVSLPKGEKSLDGAQVTDSISDVSSPKLRVRKNVQLRKAYQKKVQKEVCLPGLFSHSLSIHMPLLPENKRQKDDLKQGVKKGIIHPQRTLEKLVFSNIFNTSDGGSPGDRPELQWSIKEKMVNIKHRKVKPDLVLTNIYECIPSLPYLKLNKKTIDEIISNNVKRIKQPISQKKEKERRKVNMKGIMDPNVILKAKKSSLSHILNEKELPGLLNIIKQESNVQIGKGKSGVKLTNLFTSLPSLSHPNLISRTKGGRDKSGTPWNCLPPLNLQASSNIRKTSFAESINRDSLSNIIESKQRLPQKKKEDGDNIVYMKDIRGCKCAPFKRKKKLFTHTLHGNKPQWNNKEQEKMMQEDKSDLVVVQNKPYVSILSSPHLEWGPAVKEEAYMRGVSGFCLPPLTLQELSDAVIICEEPTDDILSSIERSKYMSQENEDKVEMALEEKRNPKRIAWEANQSPIARELQLNIKKKEEKMQEDKDERVGIQRKSCVSISSPPYCEVDTRRKGEAIMLRKTRSSFLQPKLQGSSDTGNIAHKKSVYGDNSNNVKKAKEHIMQEEEGRVKMAKVLPLEKKKSPSSQEIQLDIKEQKKKIQRIQGEPSVILTRTSIPATSFKLDTRIKEADYRAEVRRYSLPEPSHQKSSDVVKKENKEFIKGDSTSDVQAANVYMPQKGKDRGKIVNMKYIMYSKETTSKAKVLPLPHVPNTPGRCSPQIREVQTNRRKDLGHVQERRSELDEVLTGPCLPQFTLSKVIEGKKEKQGVIKPGIPSSWHRESSNAEKLKYTLSPVNDISSDLKRTKYMTQKEEDKANIFVRDLMHPKCLALKAKKSPLFHILKAKKLQVNIKEQVKRGQEGRRDTVVLLSKICPFVTSSVHLKFDTTTEEEGGPGIIRNYVPPPELQDSLPSVQIAPPRSTDSHRKKGKQHPPPKEKDRVQTAAVSGSVRASGTDFKAKTSAPSHVFSVAEHGALSRRKEPWPSIEERVEQGQGRTEDLDVAPTKTPPSSPSVSHHRLDAGTKGDEDLPAVAGFSPPPFQLPESSGAGKIRYAESSQGISSCNVIIKTNGHMPYRETKVRVKTKDKKDRIYPKIITLEAHTSPLTHLLSRNRLPLNVKEQGKEVQDSKGEPEIVLRETRASLLSPSYLKWDTSRNEKEDTERIAQSCFSPLKVYDPFNPSKKADAKSFDGYSLKDKDRLKTGIEDKVLPSEKADTRSCDGYMLKEEVRLKTDTQDKVLLISMHQNTKELPLSHIRDTKELKWKIKEQKRRVQREDSELVTKLKNIYTSLLALPYLKSDTTEGERYMIRITKLPLPQAQSKESSEYAETNEGQLSKDVKKLKEHMLQKEEKEREKYVDMNSRVDHNNMDLEAKESPILLTYNLSDLQWKTKGQEGKVQEDKWEPGDVTLTETCTSKSSPLHLDKNTSVREEGMPVLSRPSFPPVNFQKSSGSEEVVHAEPVASDTVISPPKEKHLPQNKEEDGVERGNLVSPKHHEKEMQKSKDGPGMVLTKSSTSSPSLPALKLDKEVQVNDVMLALKRSVLPRISNAGPIVHTYSISGDTMKDAQNEEQPMPEKEEREREKTVDRRGAMHTKDITLKSKKSPSSYMLHRTELHLNIGGIEQKKQESQGKPPSTVVRNIYVSKPPTKLKLDKGTQVDEGRLGIKKPSLLPRMLSALSDAKKRPEDMKGIGSDVIKRQQHMSEKEKKYDVKKVDMRLRTHHKEATISPIPHVLSTKEFVLNVIKEPGGKVYKGKDEPCMVLTRTFLSIPSAPLYLESGSKIDKDTPGIMGSSRPQQNLQESSDTQKTAIRESAAGESEIVKNAEHSVPEEAVQQWTSNFMISVQRRKEPPQVKSEGYLSRLLLNSQHEDFYFTGFGTITSGKRLECFFSGPEAQGEKYKPETFTMVLSFPMMDLTKIENLKKETEIMNNLNHKISPQVLVSLPRKLSKGIYATLGSPVSSEGFSASEQGAYQQETLSKSSPGSAESCKFDRPEEDRRNNEKISEMSSPKVLAPQTKESLEKMNITESNDPQNIEKEVVMKKQVLVQSGSGQKTRVDSSLSLKIPLQNVKQKTPLEIDMHKQTTVYPGIQILPGIHMDITEFDAQRGNREQTLLVPEQEEHSLESPQKSVSSCWTFALQSGDLEEKNKTDTSSTRNLVQKRLQIKEEILQIDTNIAVHLEEDKIEMHKHTVVNLEKETIKMDTSNTVNLNTASLKAEEPQIKSQVITHMANSCLIKQKHKKEREVSGAKQNIQPQKMFQKHVLDSFYAYIPLSPKFGGQKGRLTIADLKRELSPKYLNMKTPKHPVLQILGNTGHGTPSNRKKLEYNFNKPKKIALWREDASGIFVRSLSISMMSPSQTKETVKSEINLERAKRTCLSKFQKKSPNASETMKRDSSSTVKEGDQNFTKTVPQDSQPFMVDERQMHKLPSVKSEANLSSEIYKNLAPQTKESVVPRDDISRIVKEPDLLMIKQEKAPKPIQTPTECPFMSKDPKENCASPPKHRDQSEPVQDTAIQKVQQQKTSPGTVPVPPQVKSNEIKIVADSPSAESLLPLYEAIKNVIESQVKNMIRDKFFPNILEKVKDNKTDDWKSPPLAGGPDATSMTIRHKLQPKPILENFTCKEKTKPTNHLESKAPEIKLNLIPEVVKQSFQKFNFYQKLAISKHNSWKLYPRHKKMFFLSLEGIDTIEFNLKHKYQKDSPPVSCMKSLIVNDVSRGSEKIITKLKSINELESGTSPLTSAREMTLPHILQNYSVGEKNKLLIHFSMKTLEIQMKAFPRIVRESYTMARAQDGRKPLSKCIHSGVKVPKRKNRVLLLFEEKSLHQIDLDLQYKYLHFLLGSPVKSMFPKPNALPKHILKLQTVAIRKKIDNSGESGGLSIDTSLLEEHISFKKQSFHENSSLVRNFLEPTQVCASDPDQHNTVQKDTMALSKLKSHVTPEKDKRCHVWFQETNTCESVDLKTQEKTQDLVDSHSIQNFEGFTDSQTNIESSDNLEECSALDVHESEECMFSDANPYLSWKSQNILFELQKGMPVENLYKKKKIKTDLKPLYSEDSGSHHIRGYQKHSSIVTPPSYESHKSRKHSSSSKMRPPDPWCHSSLNTVEVLSVSSSVPFSEEKLSQTTRSGKCYSLVPLMESDIKLHLAKSQGKPHRHSESKERKKAKLDISRKNNTPWECDDSYTQSKEKHTRKEKVRDYESERSDYFPSKHKSASKPPQEDISFHSEGKQNQPFFYACIPSDSLEIIPQTVRWTIPPNTLRKKNFRIPLVAKISSSCNIWSSSKKLLGSLLGSFSLARQK
ncbi:leucine-rich repeat transmembrane protein CCDC168 [Balaenoptera ricei]|uniref:leucine-rich repeat transmembrane protein CCDC168 n=1 Tax=Balaenoptera ricei TaxID=2746895 RepID=UPI0028BD4DC4|nr:leucine-rich repeat transmembrane protein CCDC168 [Balaenoptera ricei]